MEKEKLIVIVGPTGVGKTALSLQLAQQLQGEIISGDAMQVYRQLDIGTAKVTPKEQALAPHHLIDVADIDQRFTAFDFQQQGQQLVTEIVSRQHMPLVVGGTGLYLQALLYDMTLGSAQDAEQNFTIRQKWQTFFWISILKKLCGRCLIKLIRKQPLKFRVRIHGVWFAH